MWRMGDRAAQEDKVPCLGQLYQGQAIFEMGKSKHATGLGVEW